MTSKSALMLLSPKICIEWLCKYQCIIIEHVSRIQKAAGIAFAVMLNTLSGTNQELNCKPIQNAFMQNLQTPGHPRETLFTV